MGSEHITEILITHFGDIPKTELTLVKVPGRANIIGEHIDYCGGTVMPFAIPECMYFIGTKLKEDKQTIYAADTGKTINPKSTNGYFTQCLEAMENEGYTPGGFKLVLTSQIPIGGGLSSSSALCCGFITFLNKVFQLGMAKTTVIMLASKAEYGLGLKGGLMDQYCIMHAKENHALLLDCQDMTSEHIEIDPECFEFILIDTGIRHNLLNSQFNSRRGELEKGYSELSMLKGEIKPYHSLSISDCMLLDNNTERKRLLHVVGEMQRVKHAHKAICEKQPKLLGQLLKESHQSLRVNYEVSCREADYIVDTAIHKGLCHGARIVGGGFGGHVLLLKKRGYEEDWSELAASYRENFGKSMTIRNTGPSSGIHVESYS